MKWHPLSFVVIALLSASACSRKGSAGTAPRAQPGLSAAAPATPHGLANEDLDKLQGTWRIETSFWNGVREPEVARTVTIVFQGGSFIVVDKDGNRLEETIRLMPDQNPKAIDCWSKGAGQARPGIYSLDGDTFQWCSAGGDNKVRPTSFASEPGSRQSLMVLRRKKN